MSSNAKEANPESVLFFCLSFVFLCSFLAFGLGTKLANWERAVGRSLCCNRLLLGCVLRAFWTVKCTQSVHAIKRAFSTSRFRACPAFPLDTLASERIRPKGESRIQRMTRAFWMWLGIQDSRFREDVVVFATNWGLGVPDSILVRVVFLADPQNRVVPLGVH